MHFIWTELVGNWQRYNSISTHGVFASTPAGELPLAQKQNMNREKKPHEFSQYFELQVLFNRKVFLKRTQCNFDHPKPMIFDKVLVLHASRPWEHGLLCECEAYIWIWGLHNHRKNTINILIYIKESQECQPVIGQCHDEYWLGYSTWNMVFLLQKSNYSNSLSISKQKIASESHKWRELTCITGWRSGMRGSILVLEWVYCGVNNCGYTDLFPFSFVPSFILLTPSASQENHEAK